MDRWSACFFFLLLTLAACGGSGEPIRPIEQIIELRPPAITFAPVPVQSTATSSITVKNAGEAFLVVSGVVIDGRAGPFSFRVVERELRGARETPLIVTFQPTATGLFEERVEVKAEPTGPLIVPAEPVWLEVKGEGI